MFATRSLTRPVFLGLGRTAARLRVAEAMAAVILFLRLI